MSESSPPEEVLDEEFDPKWRQSFELTRQDRLHGLTSQEKVERTHRVVRFRFPVALNRELAKAADKEGFSSGRLVMIIIHDYLVQRHGLDPHKYLNDVYPPKLQKMLGKDGHARRFAQR